MIPNAVPNYLQNLIVKGAISRAWYTFFQNLFLGVPPGNEYAVLPTGSPFTFTTAQKGSLIVQGGTVSLIQFNRTNANYSVGVTAGMFPLSSGDSLIITYSGAPALTFVPQ